MTTISLRSESSFFEPMAQPASEEKQETSQDSDWLSGQFRRVPFVLYVCWLILNFVFTLIVASAMLKASFMSYLEPETIFLSLNIIDVSQIIGLLFFLYGCAEMLYSIKTKNSRIAQQSVVKFQYNLIGAVMSFGLVIELNSSRLVISWISMFCWVFAPLIHLIGGHFVLKIFKQNHPLARRAASQVSEDVSEDFFEQNEAVTSEISKYNQQLNTWPYVVYKCWLKVAVIFELSLIFGYLLFYIAQDFVKDDIPLLELALLVGLVALSCLNGYSFFEMEVATRTRALKKSEKAIFFLQICTALSIVAYLFIVGTSLDRKFYKASKLESSLLWLAEIVLVPAVSLLGALRVDKILEQRESFVQVSSFTEKCYL